MDATNVYEMLREQLDQYSIGYPATASGIELQILKKLFTEEQAGLFLELSFMLETPQSVAGRLGRDEGEMAAQLAGMAERGLIFRHRKGNQARYAAIPFVVGIYEFQLERLDRELAGMFEQFFQEAFLGTISDSIMPLRTIPVQRSVDAALPVTPGHDAREIVRAQDRIALAKCLCRVQQDLVGAGCDAPKETCLIFGSHADYYVDNGLARYIGVDEALAVVDACDEAGLVHQPFNTVEPGGMCNCCGDCCGLLRALNQHPKPAEAVYCTYVAQVDADECEGCEACLDRCQVTAIQMDAADHAGVNPDRCIGCGLCVTTCPTDALSLALRPEDQRPPIPASGQELITRTAELRGTSFIPLAVLRRASQE